MSRTNEGSKSPKQSEKKVPPGILSDHSDGFGNSLQNERPTKSKYPDYVEEKIPPAF